MQINHKKNTAYYLSFPMVDSTSPASFATGASVTDTGYYKDGAGAWTSLAITDTVSEIGSTGVYEIDLSTSEMNHDKVLIKFTASGAADTAFLFDMTVNNVDDLATDIGTAQSDLDTLTGTDGVTLATSQPNYAPATAAAASAIETDTQDIQSRLPAALVGGRIDATIDATGFEDAAVDKIWDEATAGHASAGTTGKALTDVLADTNELQTDDVPGLIAALNDPTAAGIADAVWDEAATGHTDAGKAGAQLWTDIDAIVADTNEVQGDLADGGRLDLLIDAIKAVTDALPDSGALTSLAQASALTTVDTNVDAIKAITDAIGATAAANLARALGSAAVVAGTVDTVTNTHTPTTTEFQADDITEATADHYNGRIVIFLTGNLAGQATDITDYAAVGGIGQFTVTALTEAPANNDTFIIV